MALWRAVAPARKGFLSSVASRSTKVKFAVPRKKWTLKESLVRHMATVRANICSLLIVLGGPLPAYAESQGPPKPESKVDTWHRKRHQMVKAQIEARGVSDPRILAAMRTVPRHLFVPTRFRAHAYEDRPLPIGHKQTISQPYIVAVMTELLRPSPEDRILEIGTGSGYQAAVLAKLVKEVHSIELLPELAVQARATLSARGVKNVRVVTGNGYRGLPDKAPFDGIIVTAAPKEVPKTLVKQLKLGARMVIPTGHVRQRLKVLTRTKDGVKTIDTFGVRFVPMLKSIPPDSKP